MRLKMKNLLTTLNAIHLRRRSALLGIAARLRRRSASPGVATHLRRSALLGIAALLLTAAAIAILPARTAHADSPGLVIQGAAVSGSDIHVKEGAWASYTVKLATKPTANVTVTLSPHNDSSRPVHVQWGSGQPRVEETTFTPDNWNNAQTVNIWGNHDNDYQYVYGQGWIAGVANEVQWVYHVASSDDADYDREQEVYKAKVTDDDGISASASALTVTEDGSATYTISLITKPTGNVTVSFAVAGDESVTVSPSSLTFKPANYTTAQTVTVSAAADADTANGTATVTQTANGANYSYNRVKLTVTENDTGVGTPPATPVPSPTPIPAPKASLIVTTTDECDKDTLDVNDNPIDGMKVAQGGSCTFEVKLGKQPNASVPVRVYKYGDADGVLSYSPAKLTFTKDNWDTNQSVTVTSAATQYHGLRQANMLIRTWHTSDTTGYHNLPWTYLRVNQVKGAALFASAHGITHSGGNSAISVNEGSTISYDLKLNTKPTHNVVVTVSSSTTSDDDLTIVGGDSDGERTLTFTPSNWNTAQLVTIAAAQDDDLVNGVGVFPNLAASDDPAYDGKRTDITVTEVEDDKASLVFSSTAVTVPEGGSASYNVKLSNQPSGGVTVWAFETTGCDVNLRHDPAPRNFTTTNWNVAQVYTLYADEDGDDIAGTCTIAHDADGAEYDALLVNLTATEGDNDRRGFVVTPGSPANMDEGGTFVYSIKLGTEPTADVAVAMSVEGDSDITINPTSLTFTSSNYSTAQTVTITAAEDNLDFADDTAVIGHAVTTTDAIYTNQYINAMHVKAKDNDAALTLSVSALQVPEGSTAEYTVVLTNQPTGDVTVTVAEGTTTNDDTSITVIRPPNKTMTFTTSNWNTPQSVTLRAAYDSDTGNEVNGTRSISHTASGGGFDSAPVKTLTAVESDTAARVIIRNAQDTGNISSIAVPENGSGPYSVKLNAQPSANVTVNLSVNGDSNISVSPASLTFTSSNWSTAQTVTISATTDADLANGTATISHAASGGGYNGKSKSLTAYEIDNTGQVVIRNAADSANISTLDVPENGNNTYKVKLSHQPTSGTVSVTLALQSSASGGDTSISRSPSRLYFNRNNWNTAQTVTLRASNDSDTTAGTRNITHTANGGGYNTATTVNTLTATEVEDDYAVVLRNAADNADISTLSVTEGSAATYKVELSVAPTGSVSVAIAAKAGGDSDITVSPASLTFTANNYGTAQTVTLTAAEDNTDIINGTATIEHTASGANYANTPVASLTATESDNDTGAIVLRNAADSAGITAIDVPENGNTTYKVKLSHQPSGNVTVRLTYASGGDSDITYNKSSLYFNRTNWNVAQEVTLRARDDADQAVGTRTIVHTSSGGGYSDTANLAASEQEDDYGIILSESNLSVPEGGTASYTVRLAVVPTANVLVIITQLDASGNDSDITRSPVSLTFTPQNWSTAQTVTLSAAEDNSDLTNGSRTITHTSSSSDTGYGGLQASLTATEADNDSDGAILLRNLADDADITTQGVREGSTARYKVKLDKQPRANVTVTISEGAGDDDLTVSSTKTLRFTPSNWNTAKTVTLRAAQDNGTSFGTRTITHTPSGTNNGYASAASLTARELDDDVMIELEDTSGNDTSALIVMEGGSATYKVKLSHAPFGDVTVALTASGGDSDITFSPASLTFTTSNYGTGQTVTVSAAADTDRSNGSKTIRHNATGGGYDYARAASLAVREDDGPSLSLTATARTITTTIAQHTNAWYYKVGGNVTCNSVAQGTTEVTTSTLAWNTEYTVTGYSDSTCSTVLAPAASVTTLTPALASSNVGGTAATLTLSNWDITKDGNWYYKATTGPHTSCSSAQTSLSTNVTGLSNNTAYTYSAYSGSACSGTAIATASAFTTANPSLASSSVTARTATLTLSGWSIANNGNWYYKAASGPHTSCSSAQTSLTANVSGLNVNTAYTYSAYSDSACANLQATASAFTTLNPYLQSTSTSNSVNLSIWNWIIAKDGGWYVKEDNNCRYQTGVSVTFSALQPSTSYTFQGFSDSGCNNAITAAHTVSTTAQSNNQIQQFIQQPEETPTPPGGVGGLSVGHASSSVSVSWNAATGATGYDVNYSTDGKYSWTRAATNQSATSYTLSGADSSKDYVFAVRAVNSAGSSGWTNSSVAKAPTPPPGGVSSVTATHNGGSVSVTWSSSDGATGYDVVYSTDGKYSWTRAASGHGSTSYTLAGADSAKTYVFSVRAVNDAGASGWTNSSPASAAPQEGGSAD